jgi:hypothetical protein
MAVARSRAGGSGRPSRRAVGGGDPSCDALVARLQPARRCVLLVGLLAIVFGGDALAKAMLLLALALAAGAVVLLVPVLARRFGRRPALAATAVVLHAGALWLLVNGMETALVVFVVAGLARVLDVHR